MKKELARRLFLKQASLIGGAGLLNSCLFSADEKKIQQGVDCEKEVFRKGRKIVHRLIAVSDIHWFDNHINTEYPRLGKWANNSHYSERYDKMISFLNNEKESEGIDSIVFNGDLVTNCPEYFPEIKQKFEGLKATYHVVHGNHDYCDDASWQKLWGYNRNHTFTLGDYAFILLNSASEKGKYQCADSKWLEEQLRYYGDKKGVFVFCHIYQHDSGEFLFASVDCPEITDVMTASENLKMAVYSHNHLQDGYFRINNKGKQLKTFFTGHFSSWGLPYLGYRVLEIYDDGEIATYMYDQENGKVVNYNFV